MCHENGSFVEHSLMYTIYLFLRTLFAEGTVFMKHALVYAYFVFFVHTVLGPIPYYDREKYEYEDRYWDQERLKEFYDLMSIHIEV